MELILEGHEDLYAVQQLQMSLFPVSAEGKVLSRLFRGKTYLSAVTTVTFNGKTTRAVRRIPTNKETVRLRRQALQQSLYLAALPHLDRVPAWGALAGVRPTKLSTRHLLEGGNEKSALRLMEKTYYVTKERAKLTLSCSESSVKAVALAHENHISLYVGIPFCPTRCAYCSFVSRTVGKRTDLLEPYLQALLQEVEVTGRLLKETNKKIRTVYIGGGTPTTLSADQLKRLLDAITTHFDLGECIEFTVEAGRPDTLNEEKLSVIRAYAGRISINPQSMNDAVLRACGRPHTAKAVEDLCHKAQALCFDAINMDLIAGLPLDTVESFCSSLDRVLALNPENITVHTLALKKGADLFEKQQSLPSEEEVTQMVDYANRVLPQHGYKPYYLYRQKYMSGSFENIGWSKKDKDCLYNIYMMEELHSILSLGGGGMNKVNLPGGKVERFHNPKFPEGYLEQLSKVLSDKEALIRLMKGCD